MYSNKNVYAIIQNKSGHIAKVINYFARHCNLCFVIYVSLVKKRKKLQMHFAITMFVALLSVGVSVTLSAYLSGEEQAVFAEVFDDGTVSVEVEKV